ncbi:MAG TPA: polysaccharide deacetylase family protein [Caulobacteraceae bacterium]|jgi:peptidoglycan/xylan/chitin deacetylase (PgdA/CDA1 family)|nr:polysaccharide deacetylase family protein [Caulobacteraceae bacterium]
MKRTLIGGIGVLASPGLLALQRGREAGIVLLYHRVSDTPDAAYPPLSPRTFRRHAEILKARYDVVPLSEMVERVKTGRSVKGCCAITFDDGYRDFFEHAWPVIEALALPVTHFLVADCVRTGKPVWHLRVLRLAQQTAPSDPTAESRRLFEQLTPLSADDRYAWLDEAEAGGDEGAPAMLNADDLKRVSPKLVEWGSHTLSHPDLTVLGEAEARRELETSRTTIEAMSGRRVRYLSYPNGGYNPATTALAAACGYTAAFAVDQRELRAGENAFALPRIDVSSLPPSMLLPETTGAVEQLRRRLRGTDAR